MKEKWKKLTLIGVATILANSLAMADLCDEITPTQEEEALKSAMLYLNSDSFIPQETMLGLQKERKLYLEGMGQLIIGQYGNSLRPNYLYSANNYEFGSVAGVFECKPEKKLELKAGSFFVILPNGSRVAGNL